MPGNPVVILLNTDRLIDAERGQTLEVVSILKEKINGIIKVRTCANGSKQKRYFKERQIVASPTVLLEGLFTTLVVYANLLLTFQERIRRQICQEIKILIKIKRNISGYNVSYQSRAQGVN